MMALSSTIMSFGGLIVRNIEQADAWQINLYRAAALSVAVMLVLFLQYRGDAMTRIRATGRAGLLAGAMLAAAGMGYVQAITHTSVANTMFTLAAIPFITAAIAFVLLGERLQRTTLSAMLVAACGVFVMVIDGFGHGSAYGNLMALVTAVCFSGFAIVVRQNRQIDMLPALLVSGLIISGVAFAARFDDLAISLHDFLLCLLWGGLMAGFANWMFITASRQLIAAELTLFMLLEFALGPLWVWLFVNEVPTRWALAGGLLVIGSVGARTIVELRKAGRPLRRGRPSPM